MHEACAMAIQAGADLPLYKTVNLDAAELAMTTVKQWVEQHKIPMAQIDQSVRRILAMKKTAGLFDRGWYSDPQRLCALLADEAPRALSREAAEKATLAIRNDKNLIPVPVSKRILVVEQAMFLCRVAYDSQCHPYMLWEYINETYPGSGLVRLELFGTDEDLRQVAKIADKYDLIVATNLYWRGCEPNTRFVEKLMGLLKKDVIVIANSPFPATVTDRMETVFCVFSETPESLRVGRDIIAGTLGAGAHKPVSCI